MNCSNCEKPAGPESIRTIADGVIISEICGECQKNVTVAKIVLRREDPKSSFVYEGYLPVASR
jgi:hypothetical protein